MNNTDKLIEWLSTVAQKVDKEAPQLAEEILDWNFYGSLFSIGIGILTLIVGVILWYYGVLRYTHKPESEGWDAERFRKETGALAQVVGVVVAVVSCIPIVANTYSLIKTVVSPRLVIIDQFRK